MTIRQRLQRIEARRIGGSQKTDLHKMTDAQLLALAGLPADATDEQLAEVANRGRANLPEPPPGESSSN